MKRLIIFLLSLGILLGTTACSSADEKVHLKVSPYYDMASSSMTNYLIAYDPMSLEEVEAHADLIVKGMLLDDSQNFKEVATVSTLEITEVIQGDYQVGEQLKLIEMYFIADYKNEETLCYSSNCMPTVSGQEYLFFLTKSESTQSTKDLLDVPYVYHLVSAEKGRYPMISPKSRAAADPDTLTREELGLGKGNSEIYRAIYKQVIDKYMK